MIYLFTALFLISLIAALVGLFKPNIFKFGQSTTPNRWKVFGISLLVSLISLAIVGILAPKIDGEPSSVNELKQNNKITETTITNKDLGLTPEEFKKQFNAQISEVNIDYLKLTNFKLETGAINNTFKHMFSDAVGVVGTVDKGNDKIKEITLIYGGNSEKDVADYLIVAGVVAKVIAPYEKDIPNRIVNLMNSALENKNENKSFIVDGVTYTAHASDAIGFMLVVSKS